MTLTVNGMSCEHCKTAVKNALNALSGISNVIVNLDEKTVDLSYDESEVTVDEIKEAIEAQGYEVEE